MMLLTETVTTFGNVLTAHHKKKKKKKKKKKIFFEFHRIQENAFRYMKKNCHCCTKMYVIYKLFQYAVTWAR